MSADRLDEAAIQAALAPAVRARLAELRVHASIDSTNAELARRGALPGGARVCIAEQQSAGRGRRGRTWVSPPGGNLYLSIAWRFAGGAEGLQGFTLAVGVALCEALETLGVTDLALKWPNDVLRGGKKLAGILVELQGMGSEEMTAILGVGLNVVLPAREAMAIEQPWADLQDCAVGREELAVELLNRLMPVLDAYLNSGFAPWKEAWERRHAFAGRTVRIEQSGRELLGKAVGVDANGALLLATPSGIVSIHGGEVSLRPVP